YRDAGRWKDAIPMLEEAWKRGKKAQAEDWIAQALADTYEKTKQFDQQEIILKESLALREKKEPDAWTTFQARSALGGSLLRQQKYAEAEPLLLQSYQSLKQHQAKIPAEIRKLRLTEAL